MRTTLLATASALVLLAAPTAFAQSGTQSGTANSAGVTDQTQSSMPLSIDGTEVSAADIVGGPVVDESGKEIGTLVNLAIEGNRFTHAIIRLDEGAATQGASGSTTTSSGQGAAADTGTAAGTDQTTTAAASASGAQGRLIFVPVEDLKLEQGSGQGVVLSQSSLQSAQDFREMPGAQYYNMSPSGQGVFDDAPPNGGLDASGGEGGG